METTQPPATKPSPTNAADATAPCCTLRRGLIAAVVGFVIGALGVAAYFLTTELLLPNLSSPAHSEQQTTNASSSATSSSSLTAGSDRSMMDDALPKSAPWRPPSSSQPPLTRPGIVYLRQPVYVGVMSLQQYLGNRAVACNSTWANSPLISKVQFFSPLDDPASAHKYGLPLVTLPGKWSNRQMSAIILIRIMRHPLGAFDILLW